MLILFLKVNRGMRWMRWSSEASALLPFSLDGSVGDQGRVLQPKAVPTAVSGGPDQAGVNKQSPGHRSP
jgi:hypothetical protein